MSSHVAVLRWSLTVCLLISPLAWVAVGTGTCMIPPWLFGVRAILSVLVFAVCVYVGYLRAPAKAPT
jgi:hypothetical protein